MKKSIIFLVWLFFLLISIASADEINIVSDKMEVLESQKLVIFTGHVFAKREDFKIWCDKMYVYYFYDSRGKRKIDKIVALGRVIMEKGKWKAYAGKAVYFKKEEKLVLEETPKVWHEKNLVEGDIVIVYFKEDRSEVLAKNQGRVRATIYVK